MLSVIIPCFNNGEYLVKMINCFRQQTSSNWEMVIVDDRSTDDTPKIIEDYISDLPNVHFIIRDREPKGSVVCRNIGFSHANGEYICHLDADDLVSPTFVEHRVGYMENHPEIDYASFCAKTFNNENALPTYNTKCDTFGVECNHKDLLEAFLSVNYPFSVWNNIYRRESIKDLQWDEKVKIYTDFSYIIPGILKGLRHSFAGLHEVDYYYRVFGAQSKNMCGNFVSKEKCDSTIYLFDKVLRQLEERNDSKQRKKQFQNFLLVQVERLMVENQVEEANRFVNMLSKYYTSFFIEKLRLSYKFASRFQRFVTRRNLLLVMYIVLFHNSYYIHRISKHYNR